MEFPRQEDWSELPFPTPGDLPDPGIEPMSLASPALAGVFFTTSATWQAQIDIPITWMTLRGILLSERSQSQMLHLYDFSQGQSCRNSGQMSSLQKLEEVGTQRVSWREVFVLSFSPCAMWHPSPSSGIEPATPLTIILM